MSSKNNEKESKKEGTTPENHVEEFHMEEEARAKEDAAVRSRMLWTTRVERAFLQFWGVVHQIFKGIASPDPATRLMSFVFICCLLGALTVVGVTLKTKFHDRNKAHQTADAGAQQGVEPLGEFFNKQSEESKRRFTTLNLGVFSVELKKNEADRPTLGVQNMAEIEVMIECNERETCTFIEEHMLIARNQLTNTLVAQDRDELMTLEGKKRLKKELIDALNLWVPKGKVTNLFFSKMVVN